MTGESQSPINYKVDGEDGNRILKIEWINAGFYEEVVVDGTNNISVNFQLWIYEEDNAIEFHYGNSNIPDITYFIGAILFPFNRTVSVEGNFVDVQNQTIFLTDGHIIMGNPENPSLSRTTGRLQSFPSEGTVYRLEKSGINSLNHLPHASFDLYPNPSSGVLNLKFNLQHNTDIKLMVYDAYGRLCEQTIIEPHQEFKELNFNHLNSGVYQVLLLDENGNTSSKKWIKY